MAPVACLEGASLSVRNTFLHAQADDEDEEIEQPSMPRAKTAPTARHQPREWAAEDDKAKCAQFAAVVEEVLFAEDTTEGESAEDPDEAPAEAEVPHMASREWFESTPTLCGGAEARFGLGGAAAASSDVRQAEESRPQPQWLQWPQPQQLGIGATALHMPIFLVPAMFPTSPTAAMPFVQPPSLAEAARLCCPPAARPAKSSGAAAAAWPFVAPLSPASAAPEAKSTSPSTGSRAPPVSVGKRPQKPQRVEPPSPQTARTTVMMRNLPNNYTRIAIVEMIDSEGFAGKYDFLYFPIDFRTHAALGYAFLNLVTPQDAEAFHRKFDGFSHWSLPSSKVCAVGWSFPHQGLEAHIARYRNSPLMHESVPDAYRPILFRDGVRIPFPPPTKKVKPPRQGTERMLV